MIDYLYRSKMANHSKTSSDRSHLELGRLGELMAIDYLQRHGYRMVASNFTAPVGYNRRGLSISAEIDLVAYDETRSPFILAFVEVKTRTSAEVMRPEAAVDLRKQRQLVRAARIYRRLLSIEDEPFRYDVVSIILANDQTPQISLLKGYFDENRFVGSRWLRA